MTDDEERGDVKLTLTDKEYAVILKMRQGEFEKKAIFKYAVTVS